ncbi:MAG: cadmium resistance transporter [Acidobacteriota bacterium]|nr:cadmium resistance transporter [Acidobacteriota bacterium]
MEKFTATPLTGALTFAATNVDDIFILMLFFSQTGKVFHRWHIIVGQYLGFTALVLISLLGFFGGLIIPRAWVGLLGLLPIALGVRQWLNRSKEDLKESEEEARVRKTRKAGAVTAITSVAAVTFANGGDNIGVYSPLFAASDFTRLMILLSVFYLLIAVWCLIGYAVTRRRAVAHLITHYGHLFVPFVLVGLGVYIIYENGTLTLIGLAK